MDDFTQRLDEHGGIILRSEAIALGYDDRAIARMVQAKQWHRVRHGSYVSAPFWAGLDELGRHRVAARAVLRRAHASAALSHVSAAAEYVSDIWGLDLSEVHVTRTDGRSGRREAGAVHHRGELSESQVVIRNGVRVVDAARAAVEVTTLGTVECGLVTVNALLHGKHTTPALLAQAHATMRHWPDSLHTDVVLRLADGRCESVGETRSMHFFWRHGLPMPVPQYPVFDEYGNLVALLDFALPAHGVFIEFDGKDKYLRLRREGETLEDFVIREKRREELVCRLTGWVCIRITWEDLARPVTTARRLRALLAARRHPAPQ